MSSKKNQSPQQKLEDKIDIINGMIESADKELQKSQNLEVDIETHKTKLRKLLTGLRSMADQHSEAAATINFDEIFAGLKEQIEFPNLRQQQLHPVQEEARTAAAEVVANWERVTPGVSLKELPPDARVLLQKCTTEIWSPLQSVLNAMINERKGENPKVLTARRNFATALFQAMVPQFCGVNIPTKLQVERNANKVSYLLRSIALVARNKSEEDYNPIFVFAEAAFKNPLKFLKDATGVGFAFGALAEMVGSDMVSFVGQLPDAALTAGKYVAGNPLASFTTYHVAEPYITGLLQQVFGERFGRQYQGDERIVELFNELSKHYLSKGVTDIIGFPPADIDSVRNKLSQILYNIGYRSVASMQRTGDILSQALQFPGELCKSMMGAGSAINRWWCDKGTQLLERYKFIPQGTEDGLFEALLRHLTELGFIDDPHINAFVVAYLKHNQPTTVFHQSVEYATAQGTLINGHLLSTDQMSESLEVQASQDVPDPTTIENVGPKDGSGTVPDQGNISADRNMRSSDAGQLGQWRIGLQPKILQSQNEQTFAQREENEKAARLAAAAAAARPGAQSGIFSAAASAQSRPSAQGGVQSSSLASLTGTGSNVYPGFSSRPGGRSRSRKHSVSKRTRRKGVAKKEKSKKNKRQSRRKVRRASSHKSRK